MTEQTCMRCRWFARDADDAENDLDKGTCHRYPPTGCYDQEMEGGVTVWPLVDWVDWCGEFEEVEHGE